MIKSLYSKRAPFTLILLFLIAQTSDAAPGWLTDLAKQAGDEQIIGDASALILLKSESVRISDNGSAKTTARKAIRILSVQGVQLASIALPTYDMLEIKRLKGWRIEPSGKEHKLDKKNIVEVGIEEAAGYYTDKQTIVAMFPGAGTGDIIGYEYEVKERKGVEGLFQGFTFQDSLPVLKARLEVEIPPGWDVFTSGQNLEPVQARRSENSLIWDAANLAYRPGEPLMPPWEHVTRMVRLSCHNPGDNSATQFSNWETASRWAYDLHFDRSAGNDSLRTIVADLTGGLNTIEEKVKAVAEYVRDEVRYVAVEIGVGRFQPREANATLSNRFGDCKDKATLMRAMLSELGVESRPVLARAGGTVDESMPCPFQFNHCIVSFPVNEVPQLDGMTRAQADGWVYFDPTDPSTALGHLPVSLQGSYVLPVAPASVSLVGLPKREMSEHQTRYYAKAEILADHSMKASVRIVHYGERAAAVAYSRRKKTVQEQIDRYKDSYLSSMNNPAIDDYLFEGDGDSVWTTFNLRGGNYLQQSGDISMIKADFFHSDRKNRLKKTKNRIHPVWFGEKGIYETVVDWTLPDGWVFQSGNDTVHAECDIAKMTYILGKAGGSLRFYSNAEYFGGTISPTDYNKARKFHRKRNAVNSTRILIAESE